jgi:predicted transcriptional regulator
MTISSTTVRISTSDHNKLRKLAEDAEMPLADMLGVAIEALYRRRFVERANAAYAKLKANPKQRKEWEQEQAAWNKTLADGLD